MTRFCAPHAATPPLNPFGVRNRRVNGHDAGDDVVQDGHYVGHAVAGFVLEKDLVHAELGDGTPRLPDQKITGSILLHLRDAGEHSAVGTVLLEIEAADALAGAVLGLKIHLPDALGRSPIGEEDDLVRFLQLAAPADLIACFHAHAFDTGGDPALDGNRGERETDAHTAPGEEQEITFARGRAHIQEGIALLQGEGGILAAAHVIVGGGGPLDHAVLRDEEEIRQVLHLCRITGEHEQGLLALLDPGEDAGEELAAVFRLALGQTADADGIAVAQIREDIEVLRRSRFQEEAGAVRQVLLRRRQRAALQEGGKDPLQVAALGIDDDGILGNRGIVRQFHRRVLGQLQGGAAFVRILLGDGFHFLPDDLGELLSALQDALEAGDQLQDIGILLTEGFDLQVGEALQAHIEDRLGLLLGEGKPLHKGDAGILRALAGPDQGDDFVQVIQGDHQAFQDMGAGFGLRQVILGAAGNDLLLIVDIAGNKLLQGQLLRLAADDGDHVDAEGDLQVGILIEIGQDPGGIHIPLQLDDGAHAGAVALVPDVIDAGEGGLLLLRELLDLLQHGSLVHLVRDLGNDEQLPAGRTVLDAHTGTEGELALASLIAAADLLVIQDDAAGREVRAGEDLHQVIQGDVRILHLLNALLNDQELNIGGIKEFNYLAKTYNKVREQNINNKEKLLFEAEHDKLTHLYNRNGYDIIYKKLDLSNLAYLLIDIDKFKDVNDTCGHDKGDEVLSKVGEILTSHFDNENTNVFRIGGDEFAILIEKANESIYNEILKKFIDINNELNNLKISVSISGGLAIGTNQDTNDSLFKKADIALYWCKSNERGRLALYNERMK